MFLLPMLRGTLVTLVFSITIILITLPILAFALLKLIVPVDAWRQAMNPPLDAISDLWIRVNNWQQAKLLPTQFHIEGDLTFSRNEWYMLVANHQSWVDILVLMRVFNAQIPGMKFFFKQSLLWVPALGLALWGLDFPYMRRYSKKQLEQNPALKGRDTEQARRACERFRHHPVTIINFLEGTRFTPEKHAQLGSTYVGLLPPKAGGMASTLAAMNGQLHQLMDVTICYPQGIPSYWQYACGKVGRIHVHLRQLPITAEMIGDYQEDETFRHSFQQRVNQLWQEKEDKLAYLRELK